MGGGGDSERAIGRPGSGEADSSAAPAPGISALLAAAGFTFLWLGVLAASYLKADPTRNDFERFGDLRLSFLYFALIAGLSALYTAIVARPPAVSRKAIAIGALGWSVVLVAAFPIGSKDVFLYASYGRILHIHASNPYVSTPADFPGDVWDSFVQHRWRDQPTVYGPLFLWEAWALDAVAGTRPWVVVWLYKVLAAALFLAAACAAACLPGVARGEPNRRAALLLLAWNPLLLFETAGNAHNDAGVLVLVLGALAAWAGGRRSGGLALLAISIWYKWYTVLFLPSFLLDALKASGGRVAARCAIVFGIAAVTIGAVALAPFRGSVGVVVHQLLHPAVIQGIYPNELSPPLAALFWGLRGAGLFEGGAGMVVFQVLRAGTFALLVAAVWWRQWRAPASLEALLESCFLIGLSFFSLLVTMLLPWHLLVVTALGLVCARRIFALSAAAVTVLSLLSYFLTFGVAALMLALALGSILLLRRGRMAYA
jgi:hypothetical protein